MVNLTARVAVAVCLVRLSKNVSIQSKKVFYVGRDFFFSQVSVASSPSTVQPCAAEKAWPSGQGSGTGPRGCEVESQVMQ